MTSLLQNYEKYFNENNKELTLKDKITLILKNVPSKKKFKYCLSYYEKFFKFSLAAYRLSFLLALTHNSKNTNKLEEEIKVMYISSALKEEIVYFHLSENDFNRQGKIEQELYKEKISIKEDYAEIFIDTKYFSDDFKLYFL